MRIDRVWVGCRADDGVIELVRTYLPNYAAIVTFWNLGLTFGLVSLIAGTSSYLGIRKVLRVEPFEIFRS